MLRLTLALMLFPALAHAQALVCAVVDASQVNDAQLKRAQRATENALRQLASLSVGEGPPFKKSAPRRCEGQGCFKELAGALGTAGAALLDVRGLDRSGERVSVELQLWLEGERLGVRQFDTTLDNLENAVRAPLEALLPAWARKGFGGLRLQVEPGSTVKIDGRLATAQPGQVQAVPAGTHQVDVVFPEGHAVMQRLEVPEGSRVKVEAQSPQQAVAGKAPAGFTALRGVSYGTFMAGAATLAGGLVAGALSKNTANGLTPCQGDVRDCQTLVEVQRRQAEAQSFSDTGNVLLGVGAGLVVTGVVLFIIDAAAN